MGPLTPYHTELAAILEVVRIEDWIKDDYWFGRPSADRKALGRAFVAKAVNNAPTTRAFRDRLLSDPVLRRMCGWEKRNQVPSEATFSRVFAEFAESRLCERVHEALIKRTLSDHLFGHISQDSTEIEAREKPAVKKERKTKPKKKRGRPAKGETPVPDPTRIERQMTMTVEEMVAELPTACDRGVKRNSKGHMESWNGFKFHVDAADGQIPISCLLTSASLHDSQASIPLTAMTHQRVTSLYDVKDSAYDCQHIAAYSRSLGHVPIIDPNNRKGEKRELDPAKKVRFRERSTVERVNSRLKDEFGGKLIRVRGAVKVMAHLMFGILALTADQLLRMVL
ncbi:MAG: transposase [Candidatus Sumerlaeota bacterium]|nr:transposase [Candidatus Sumerlaeota bacterium]